jgi:CheY-like chemotaxis protein
MGKILVVDDDPDFMEITRIVLQKAGHQVLTASNGDRALEVIRQSHPEVVLLDIMMGGVLDGLNASHQIQQDPAIRDTRVIMVTSIMDTQHASMFPTDEYLPIDAWLTKPVQPETLLKTVSEAYAHIKHASKG